MPYYGSLRAIRNVRYRQTHSDFRTTVLSASAVNFRLAEVRWAALPSVDQRLANPFRPDFKMLTTIRHIALGKSDFSVDLVSPTVTEIQQVRREHAPALRFPDHDRLPLGLGSLNAIGPI